MGRLIYGESGIQIDFEDHVLAHIQIVVGRKLRRSESFFFSWKDHPSVGSGRSSLWMDTSIPLVFSYTDARTIDINRDWIRLLTLSADSAQGMTYVPEPGAETGSTPLPKSRV